MQIKLFLLFFIYFEVINSFQLFTKKRKNEKWHYKRLRTDPVKSSYPIVLGKYFNHFKFKKIYSVPGDGGNRLRANLTGKPSVVHYNCYKKTDDFFDLWLNLQEMTLLTIDCWADNMK